MNILILGSGAREHAFAFSLSRSPTVHKLYACPGNGGMKDVATRIPFSTNADLVKFAKEKVELVIVGSSKFIAIGTVDALSMAGIPVIAPAADAGRIETSKAFASAFITRHNIPAPITQIVTNLREAEAFLKENPWVGVVKCDRYNEGTGVAIVDNEDDALAATEKFLKVHGPPILFQERLKGMECSYSILTDGHQWVSFSSSRDYKKALDRDEGPTTGGMGSVSPSPDLTPELDRLIKERIVGPTVQGLAEDKLLYRGFLSIQLMLTSRGPRVLEFNARLGDPEAQSILARFRGNLADLLMDCAMGRLDSTGSEVAFGKHASVAVVLARKGYPLDESADPRVENLEQLKNSSIFHSNSEWNDNDKRWKFGSGRLVTLTALGDTLKEAHELCYSELARLHLSSVAFRTDIGK